MTSDADLRLVLNAIEREELPLLSWGVSNGSLAESELETLIAASLPGSDIDDVLDELIDRGLVVPSGITSPRYRSRMAETVRLAGSLRQWFHGHDWRVAPSLVSDSRFLSKPRVVPDRGQYAKDRAQVELAKRLGTDWSERHAAAFDAVWGDTRGISSFQQRSTFRLLERFESNRGTVVSAGTGAGKTLSFYLPVLTRLIAEPATTRSTRVLAIYPRVELLRDQLGNLLRTTRQVTQSGSTPPRIGVLYGSTPWNRRNAATDQRRGWEAQGDGLTTPILACLRCGGDYKWPDRAGDNELLECVRCGDVLPGDQLSFTRSSLQSRPPAILFTTTEMLNRHLGTPAMRQLLVGDRTGGPEYLLLDEVHTYASTHGAQVGNLLRRWRAEVTSSPHIVGLSATLADPIGFFAGLTGLPTTSVAVVTPEPHEMQEVSREYFLALRGDPASETALLSTTIQTAMLLRRMLDSAPDQPSHGAFGTRVFAFTDDLDITNRLHSQLADAEGWQRDGINRRPAGSLATLRSAASPDAAERDVVGQLWEFADQIGTLNRTVRVSRTTSQDSGVDPDADIVVATASLEVGFDDPDVGAVLQHKAPRDAAQFLQRRGRAGRSPLMRPWTAVVLSDYGRDRLAFQSYESLFDPVVRPAVLPLHNRVILKMQATWWLVDFLSKQGPGGSLTSLLDRVGNRDRSQEQASAKRQLQVLKGVLTESGTERIANGLRWSLGIGDDDVRAVLWDYPRGLLTAVVPSLIRRLEAIAADNPPPADALPPVLDEFVPSSLFAPLQTPEVRIFFPGVGQEPKVEAVSQALRQFAPGRVSYRYSLRGRSTRHWTEPPAATAATLAIEQFTTAFIEVAPPPGVGGLRVVQPTALRLAQPPAATSDSSYGRWQWRVAWNQDAPPIELDIPSNSAWSKSIEAFQALTHRHRCPSTIWRFATTFEVELNAQNQPPLTTHDLTLNEEPAAVGFSMEVDSLLLRVALPTGVSADDRLVRALRVARTEYLTRTSDVLTDAIPSIFLREWLHQVALSVLVSSAAGSSLEAGAGLLTDDQFRARIVDAARDVFGALPIASQTGTTAAPDPGLVQRLSDAVQIPGVITELRRILANLWATPDDTWLPWIHERFLATIGSALIEAIQRTCPDVDASDLRCDFDAEDGRGELRVSEEQPGGVGVIEAFVDRYLEDPRAFWALVSAALRPGDGERVDLNLRRYLTQTADPELTGPASSIRSVRTLAELTAAWSDLRTALFRKGLDSDQSVLSALSTRLLRPGSSPDVEQLVTHLLNLWAQLEANLGIEIELRVFAFVAAADPQVRTTLHRLSRTSQAVTDWEIGQIVGLLWPRGGRLRSSALSMYSPYRTFEPSERLLFDSLASAGPPLIDTGDQGWREVADDALRSSGSALLRTSDDAHAAAVIQELVTEPTAVGVLELHPRVVGVTRSEASVDLEVELREAHQ